MTMARHPRPLLVASQPHPEESFQGFLARAAHRNRLGHTRFILEDVGLHIFRQGNAPQQISDGQIRDLASKLGCDPVELERKRTSSAGKSQVPLLKWGGTIIRSSDMTPLSRRVCPHLMSSQDWLPAQWTLKHLPYCADCLSHLVDHCAQCGVGLGWDAARGVAACPDCRMTVSMSSEPRLPDEYRSDYKTLFDISSLDQNIRQASLAQFPKKIASLDLHHILDLALGVGQAFIPANEVVQRPGTKLPSLIVARAFSKGVSILKNWPHGLIKEGENFVARGRLEERHFWKHMKRLRHSGTKDRFPGSFIRNELPGLVNHRRLSVAGLLSDVMGTRELQLATGIQVPQLQKLRHAGLLGKVHETGIDLKSFQVDQKIGEDLTRLMRDSLPIGAVANRLGVPIYTVEQLACLGEVEAIDHEALECLGSSPRISKTSFENLLARVETQALRLGVSCAPTISLRGFCTVLHCGEKPYAAFISAMLKGTIKAFLHPNRQKRSEALLSRILVEKEFVECLELPVFDALEYPSYRFEDTYIQRDAADVIGVNPCDIRDAVAQGLLSSRQGRKASLHFDRSTIRSAAESHINWARLAYITGRSSTRSLVTWCSHNGLPRTPLGWPKQSILLRLQEAQGPISNLPSPNAGRFSSFSL